MHITLAGVGGGTWDTMTYECVNALSQAQCVIGSERLLEMLPSSCTAHRMKASLPEQVCKKVLEAQEYGPNCVVLYSGDTGFYSGAALFLSVLKTQGLSARVLPGISSVQLLAAKLGRSWQDWNLVSAHGKECNPVAEVCSGRPTFFLTGGCLGPAELCSILTQADLGDLSVWVGEDLSYPNEKITALTAKDCAVRKWTALSVLLVDPAPRISKRTPGIEDEAFVRGEVPMTKREVRAAILSKLAVGPNDVCWDVGAGTGSVSVELALCAERGQVFAIECEQRAVELIEENRKRFKTWNLAIVPGYAPDALKTLPAPDVVFVGGSKGKMQDVVQEALTRNPSARICITAIALETLGAAVKALTVHGLAAQVTQICVNHAYPAGNLHLLMANNPIFLIAGNCP